VFIGSFVGAVAVVTQREWGRRLVIFFNMLIIVYFMIRYLPQIEILDLSYLFLSIIVLLYFNQDKIKYKFYNKQHAYNQSILIIDDDIMYIKTIRPILMSAGYSVLAAQTGEEGMQIAKNQQPDLIILDVILPGIKGREVCKALKDDEATKRIPVVFLTAKDSPDDIAAEKAVGAIDHLTKPVHPKTLIETLRHVLAS
jgi:CheY-like chemotaxis protein